MRSFMKGGTIMGYENVGLVWTPDTLTQYLSRIKKSDWCEAITLHHTAEPSLVQRPKGFLIQHIESLRSYYRDDKGWSAGPHCFIDEDQIWGMCDFRRKGVHAVSFNRMTIGIEVLGNYHSEDPHSGRGLACWQTAAAAARVLLNWLDLDPSEDTVLFHRDDPETAKDCPGDQVKKDWVLSLIKKPVAPKSTETDKPDVGIPWSDWDFAANNGACQSTTPVAKGISSPTVISNLNQRGQILLRR
jgi:hypothetical protein